MLLTESDARKSLSVNCANFSQNFTTCGSSFGFVSIFITLQAESLLLSISLLRAHLFIHWSIFRAGLPRFIRVLSKIEYSYLNQNGESKMPDTSKSFFNNNWSHHDVTVVVKDSLCFSQLLDMIWCHYLWKKEL